MTADAPAVQVDSSAPLPLAGGPGFSGRLLLLEAGLLLVFAHVLLAGYQLGAGNQSIQIPYLKYWTDPELYKNDPMVSSTIAHYPSFFFRGLAVLVKHTSLAPTYFALHILTALGVFAACLALGKAIFNERLAGLIAIVFLFAGHHDALAGDGLYSLGFTHTWAVFPLAIACLVLLYRDQHVLAFLLAGLLFNLHALTAGYLLVMMGCWAAWAMLFPLKEELPGASCQKEVESSQVIVDRGQLPQSAGEGPAPAATAPPRRREITFFKLLLLVLVFLLAAGPTLYAMLQHRQAFDAEWLRLTRIRSADHSFPSTWWQAGSNALPRFGLLLGLGALSLSFRIAPRQRRKTLLLAAGCGLLFAVGFVFTELYPSKTIIRAQLFRASRLLMILLFMHIGHGVACAWRMLWASDRPLHLAKATLELIGALAILFCLAVPSLLALLPAVVVLVTLIAWINGRLSVFQALFVSAVLLIALVAWREIHFLIPGVSRDFAWTQLRAGTRPILLFWVALGCGLGVWLVVRLFWQSSGSAPAPMLRLLLMVQGVAVCVLLAFGSYKVLVKKRLEADNWVKVQQFARSTPKDKVFLTPLQPGGFRIHSERAVVGEWRDGTQLYFSAGFSHTWDQIRQALQPDMLFDEQTGHTLSNGRPLDSMSDPQLIELARSFKADYLVLPGNRERGLKRVYADKQRQWAVYEPVSVVPPGALDAERWVAQERFMQEVALPNIEKYRKGEARLLISDESGKPVQDLTYTLRLAKHHFGFGASLHFFGPVPTVLGTRPDFRPPAVAPQALERFLEVFNYTVIPFSGKWMYLEPEEGKRNYEELDKYVDWCARHGIEMEFHYLSGIAPSWMIRKTPAQQAELFRKHALEVVQRYHQRIRVWQVVNDTILLEAAPPIMQEIRRLYPDLRLGISDCTKFYRSSSSANLYRELYRGLDDVRYLAGQNAKADFFAPHGHAPHGLWADVRDMYASFDAFAREGTRVHVSEFMIPLSEISGPVRYGAWTPELQAEFVERFYTVCFSHPAVAAVNYWDLGPASLNLGANLLDENYNPTPALLRLKELVKNRWTTQLAGRLPADGALSFKGFHGDYELTVTLPSGQSIKATFPLRPNEPNQHRLRLNAAKGTLEKQ